MTQMTGDAFKNLQTLLDLFSQTPGAILYRGPEGWKALEPTKIGDILTLDENLLPTWQEPNF